MMDIANLAEYLQGIINLKEQAGWMTQVGIIVFGSLVLSYLASRSLGHMQTKLKKTKTFWDDALVHSLRRPVQVAIWIIGLAYAGDVIFHETNTAMFAASDTVRDLGVILTLGWFLLRFVKEGEQSLIASKRSKGESFDQTLVDAMSNILRATIIITVGLVALQTLGFSISGVLALGGAGGIAVGFAARDLLANFFGALMVYLDKPFKVGDWIKSPDRNLEGTVEKIGRAHV